tara:strand:+ start:944 stop:1531 length:588 start_codon:yes stop_codon:yes gene_type:complete
MNIKIKDKKVGAILTDQRCGSTTLCGYIDQLKGVQCLYEAFSANGSLYSSKITYPLEDYINHKMRKMPWLSEKKHIVIKFIKSHRNIFDQFLQEGLIDYAIVLTRDPEDSYKSLYKSLSTGDWSTNPEQRKNESVKIRYKIPKNKIIKKEEYLKQSKAWSNHIKNTLQSNNIASVNITFEELIKKEFNIKEKIKV